MSKNSKVYQKKADGVLVVKVDGRTVIAFDSNRNKLSLRPGEYPFYYADNPCNPQRRALHLMGTNDQLFVDELVLKSLDREFWEIRKVNSR